MICVGIDTSATFTTQAGIARYVRGLISGLDPAVAAGELRRHEIAWPVTNFGFRQPARALKTFYRELVWARFIAPRQIQALGAEVFHNTAYPLVAPPSGVRHVVTLHDLAVLRHPQRFRPWHRNAVRRRLGRLHGADRMICVSRFTADEAMQLLDLAADRLEIVHNGCDFVDAPVPDTPPSFPVPPEFFLFVGTLEPGKNLSLLRSAYDLARGSGRTLPPLLIVGARWAGVAREGQPPEGWHYLGRIPDGTLGYLYRRALALAFPSRYEGFGIPVAEAMALGCPVICSPVASLPEVADGAALLVEQAPEAYLEALDTLSRDAGRREELRAAGHARAPHFSWRRCATETLTVYRNCAAR